METRQRRFIPPHQDLAILLTYAHLRPHEQEKAHRLIDGMDDWQAYFDLCISNKVAPINAWQLKELGAWDKVPAEIREQLEKERLRIKGQNETRIEEAKKFLGRFVEEGIPCAVIKGSALGKTVYNNPNYKRMNDIDLLIRKEDRHRIYKIYEELDYFPLGERISGNREKSDKLTHLAPHYVSRNMKCVIGTQWGIKTALGPFRIDYNQIWARMRPIDYFGIPLQVMCPEDNLHHLCLHLGFYKIALRDMMDIFNIPRVHGTDFDWELFMQIVAESNSHNVAYHALLVAHRLHPQFELWECAKRLEPKVSRRYLRTVKKKTASLDLLLNMFSDQIQSVELALSRFDLTDEPREKWSSYLSLWGAFLRPPRKDAIRIGLLHKPNRWQIFKAHLRAPGRIFAVVADEVGWKIVFLLMLKTWVEVWVTTFKRPFLKKENVYNWERFAADLGITMEQLQKLEKHFQ